MNVYGICFVPVGAVVERGGSGRSPQSFATNVYACGTFTEIFEDLYQHVFRTCGVSFVPFAGAHLPDEGDRALRNDLRATRADGRGANRGWQEQEHRRS